MSIVTETNLPLKSFKKGKVRDVYDVNDKLLLIVTDRISVFDFVLHEPIPKKGICLTQISKFWFDYFKDSIPSHFISADIAEFPEELKKYKETSLGGLAVSITEC